jgi:hypothetical protein
VTNLDTCFSLVQRVVEKNRKCENWDNLRERKNVGTFHFTVCTISIGSKLTFLVDSFIQRESSPSETVLAHGVQLEHVGEHGAF